ncbi:MAG: ATPase [Lysobacteraceae bacterium]|nr:MAG: ATPase [Xanthomonadaceae bacterium]
MSGQDKLRQATSVRNVLWILGAIWIGLLLYNALVQVSGYLTIRDYQQNFLGNVSYMTLKVWLPWVVLSPLVVLLARKFPIRPDSWVRMALTHALLLVILSVLAGSALSFHYHFREEMTEIMKTYAPWQHTGHFLFGDSLFLYNAIIYTVFITSFNIQSFYQQAVDRERQSALLQIRLQEARLKALKMQVNPHFLFNTLNSISVLVMKQQNAKAQTMIQRLGNFFRSSLEDSHEQWVPLAKELETISEYLGIEQIRFEDRLTINEDYDPAAMNVQVPSMILQPLVENAMQHGVAGTDLPCELSIRTVLDGGRLRVRLTDTGAGCSLSSDDGFKPGVGLSNVRERLETCYGEAFRLQLDSEPGQGTEVVLDAPAQRNA